MRAKNWILYLTLYLFIAITMGLLVINAESLGLLGTNTMESSCHYSQVSYLSTIWDGTPCGFTLETLIILWLCIMPLLVIGTVFSYKVKKDGYVALNINFAKWLLVFIVVLFMTASQYWKDKLLTIETFSSLVIGTAILLSPFVILSFVCRVILSKKHD